METIEDETQGERINGLIMSGLTAGWFFVVGASIGSFLNVVIYRLPRALPIWGRRSHCPNCGAELSFRENLPILGWLRLRGRCRWCQTRISPRYPLIELLTGLAFLALLQMELLTGGRSIPLREPNAYAGVVWIIWYPKWDLIAVYAYHLLMVCGLICLAAISWDDVSPPSKLLGFLGLTGWVLPALMANLHPVPPVLPRHQMFPATGFSPAELATGGLGAGCGIALGMWLTPTGTLEARRSALAAILGLTGLYLGWQAVISVSLMTALGLIALRLLRRDPGGWPAVLAATLAFVQILLWRNIATLGVWPSHLTTMPGWIGWSALLASLGVLYRATAASPSSIPIDECELRDTEPEPTVTESIVE